MKTKNPIATTFIHSLFRSGSTYIYNALKRTGKFHVYHEPFHEVIGSLPSTWVELVNKTNELKKVYRHDFLGGSYFDEYSSLLPMIKEHFHPCISYNLFFLGKSSNSDLLRSYIDCLISGARNTPVLQCTRSIGRIEWLKEQYSSKHVFLLRNPWDQWYSYRVDNNIAFTPQIIYSQPRLPAVLYKVQVASNFKPLPGDDFYNQLAHSFSHPIIPEVDYSLFFGLWLYAFANAHSLCDIVIDMDSISEKKSSKVDAQEKLSRIGLIDVDLNDCNLHRTAFKDIEIDFYKDVEEKVLEIFRLDGLSEDIIQLARNYLDREREKTFVSVNEGRIDFSGILEDSSRLRADLIKSGNTLARTVGELRQLVTERDGQICNLSQVLAERDGQIAALDQVLNMRDGQIAALDQVVAERDGQIAALDQVLAERDEQIATQDQMVAERDVLRDILHGERERANVLENTIRDQKDEIKHIINDKDWEILQLRVQLDSVLQSHSWRLTKSLRALGSSLRRFGFTKSKIQTRIWRIGAGVYHCLPLNMSIKIKIKNHVYRRFGRLFSNTAGYQDWKRLHGGAPVHVRIIPHPNYPDPSARKPFSFPGVTQPKVSIIIPIYNKSDYTYACLQSIFENQPQVKFEIIVMDDCSTDDTYDLLSSIGGIVTLRNESNQGFLKTCNRGAQAARGEYLLFLNNDTLVHRDWLDELYSVLSTRMDIGLVGSQLIYANGLLQESGCLLCQDGSSIPLGRLEEPSTPTYSYFREVDFCSGASILVRRTDFEAVGGLDSSYAPAYYEDPDLALKLRAIGKKTYVQPLSKVTHFENVSYGEIVYGELTNRNRKIFLDKWSSELYAQLYESYEDYQSNERYGRKRVLYIDALVPVPDRGAGSVDAFYFMSFLVEEGYDVVFYGQHTPDFVPKYTPMIQRIGVECLYRPYIDFERYLSEHGKSFSHVLVARVYQAEEFDPIIRRYCPNARYIFNTVDVHFLRERRQAEVEKSTSLRAKAEHTQEIELGIMARADATIVISTDEKTLLEQHYGQKRIHHIPLIREIYGSKRKFSERRDLVFIGSAHLPNVDGVLYFHREIFPLIRSELPEVQLIVIGEELQNALRDEPGYDVLVSDPSVRLVGFVEDLAEYFDYVRVMVVPLRYGSGVKGKIASALSYGVPCVSTVIGIEGMSLTHEDDVLEADGPVEFARQVVRLYKDGTLWEKLSKNGLAFMSREYSLEMGKKRLLEIFASTASNKILEDVPPIKIKNLASYDD